MSLIINHNLSAMQTHRNLQGSGNSMAKSIEKLSSGYKINVGADDPSGLIISEQLRSQISGLERAVRNSSEAFNLIGIAEGALNEMNSILKKMRALAIHAANNGVTSPEQVAADQAEMDSGIATLDRIANTTRYSDQYLLNGQKELVYDVNTVVNEPTDHALLDTKMTRVDQVFKREGVKLSIGFTGEQSQYKANTTTSAQRAYLEADAAYTMSQVSGANVTAKQEFILTGTGGSRLFSFKAGTHLGEIVSAINNVRDSTSIGATLTFASDVRIDQTVNGVPEDGAPDYGPPPVAAAPITGFSSGSYVYQTGDVQIYGAGLNNADTAKIENFTMTPDAAAAFKVGYNCDGDGKIYAKIIDKSTNAIEYYKDKDCTMLIGKGDDSFFAATNNSGIPSSPKQNLDGIFIELNADNCENLDVFEIAVVGQRLDNMKDITLNGLSGWADIDASVMSGIELGVNTSSEGGLYFKYTPLTFKADGKTVATFKVEAFTHSSYEPQYLVASSGSVENNLNIPQPSIVTASGAYTPAIPGGQTVRLESVKMANGQDSGLNVTLNLPKPGTIESVMEEVALGLMTSGSATYDPAFAALQTTYSGAKAAAEAALTADLGTISGATAATKATLTSGVQLAGGSESMVLNLEKVMVDAFQTYFEKGMTAPPTLADYIKQVAEASNAYGTIDNLGLKTDMDAYIAAFTGAAAGNTYGAAYQTFKDAEAAMNAYLLNDPTASVLIETAVARQMPKGEEVGSVDFVNLGMRVYAVDYGSQETIRIQNNAGELFYYYREADTLEKVMVKPDKTVQVAGQDAEISLNGAPVFTTGLVANTTTPDFSGSLVFNAGKLGLTTLAVAGYESGKLFSKATALQGIEENEALISENRRHFEPPALNIAMGVQSGGVGMLDKTGKPINLYVDFSQIDPTVEVKVSHLDEASAIKMMYSGGRLIIDATALGADLMVDLAVSPEKLAAGFYITDPALKGLYVKTDNLVDLKKSNKDYLDPVYDVTAYAGNVMLEVNTFATNPRSNTSERMENFLGGMQFQLGNTEGDQDRTIYSVQSMAMSNLGRIEWNGEEYCLQNVLGGGVASLSKDPILAMRIIGQAVDDVSSLRARLGAFQSNMLQTNINSLNVAIENITKTEAAIRDTDMAEESTQFTRFQIMQQAGTSMLAQANQVSQNVLSLLQ